VAAAKHRAARRRGCLGGLFWLGIRLGFVAVLVWAVVALGYYAWALTFDLADINRMPERSSVYDRYGKYFSRLAGENRIVVPFDKVSNDFVNALLAREDTRFYRHHGIDPVGILRAILRNFVAGGFRQGASTITQQLARNSFPLGGKNLHRKMIEAALAYRIETELTKEEILEAYMNRIYLGAGCYGVEAASRAYFGKPASRMGLAESAMLAGLIRSPSRFSPARDPKRARRERDVVLERMCEVGFITEKQRDAALASQQQLPAAPDGAYRENWAMQTILDELSLVLDPDDLGEGGLQIFSMIDPVLQAAAENSVAGRLREIEGMPGYPHAPKSAFGGRSFSGHDGAPYLEGAAVALESATGAVRAIVGGRDREASNFNRALHGKRQVGSAVKPFVYAKAFEKGLKPGDRVSDDPITRADLPPGSRPYQPENSDGTYHGMLPAAEGLVQSRNTMAVRVAVRAGIGEVADCVRLAGLAPDPPRYPSIALGTFESSLKDLTAGFAAFDNGGVRPQPFIIERVTDSRGNLLFKATRGSVRVFPEKPARATAEILRDVLTHGTASGARKMGAPRGAAGKTGTTNDYRDAWFVGFDDGITCGVWVGFDRPRRILPGGSGARLALPIWIDIMRAGRE